MGLFGPLFGDTGGASSSSGVSFPVLTNVTTEADIAQRIVDVIQALVPGALASQRFREFTNEEGADFIKWATTNPTAALRRFQVRDTGDDQPPAVSNTDYEEREVTFTIIVAYPQNERAGRLNGRSRDRVRKQDQRAIDHAVGMCGRPNFSPPSFPDASCRSSKTSLVKGKGVDFLVIEQMMAFRSALFG